MAISKSSQKARSASQVHPNPQPDPLTSSSHILDGDCTRLLRQIQNILVDKAPEALPLLEQLVSKLPSLLASSVDTDKRLRSVVFYGVPEAKKSLPPSVWQAHTEKFISDVLDTLEVEARPVELFRMGVMQEGKPRLVKCVFASRRFQVETLSRSRRLRSCPLFQNIYVRRSMTRDERERERELRQRARELNEKEHGGSRVYVVYRGELMKVSDIPNFRNDPNRAKSRSSSKN
ncbi:hypothetical protein Q1695_004492 [Nippostrongylus brasiliensis]|nr:hypothetical protein Q1695_004492 [Nippostrongylus brasiliensis]